MGIKQLYNDNLRKLPNEYGDVSIMINDSFIEQIDMHYYPTHCFKVQMTKIYISVSKLQL